MSGAQFKAPRRQKRTRQIKRFVPGYDRTGGYYGRYSGAGGEKKFFDTNIGSDVTVTAALLRTNLAIIAEGNGESNRIGRKVTVKNIHVQGIVALNSATSSNATSDIVYCMIVLDKQTNGSLFNATDLLDTDGFTSFRNLANSHRFKVLKKIVMDFSAGGGVESGVGHAYSENLTSFSINHKCSIDIEFDNSATTGVITSCRSNNIYFVTQSGSGLCGITARARIRYTDR